MTDPRTHSSIVEEVRQQLTELGFVVNPDDDLTTAICAFQQQRGLVVDGQIGAITRRARVQPRNTASTRLRTKPTSTKATPGMSVLSNNWWRRDMRFLIMITCSAR